MSSWLNGLMGKAVAPVQELSVATLIQRVHDAGNEDRRKSIADLRAMADSGKNIKNIGVEGLPVFMNRLKAHKQDVDTRAIIQLLISIMSIPGSELRNVPVGTPQYENIEIFVKDPSNADILLSLLEEPDRTTRYYSTKLLTYLLANKCQEIETAVLKSAANITRLMDLLKLDSEMIRNETLLLLIEITKKNMELQKIIAFEGGFDNLLDVISEEGFANGGIVVQDCLTLINNLLIGNTSNQNHFREMNNIKKLPKLLVLDQSDHWILTDDKKEILCLTLSAISALVSSGTSIAATQNQLHQAGILSSVIQLALSGIKAPTVRINALWALGDLIINNPENRGFLEKQDFKTSSAGRNSAMVKVSQVIFLSKVPKEELGALHVLRGYLIGNPEGQRLFAATVSLPQSLQLHHQGSHQNPHTSQDEVYPGRLIAKQILTWETQPDNVTKTFYAAMALGYILIGNPGVKDQLLGIPFDTPLPGMPIENLLAKLTKSWIKSIQNKSEIPIALAFLRAIAIWIEDCPAALQQFCSIPSYITFLLDTIRAPSMDIHIAGLAAFLASFAFSLPSVNLDHFFSGVSVDHYFSKMDTLSKSSDFIHAETGIVRTSEDESKLSYYDKPFVQSFLKQYQSISTRLRPNHNPTSTTAPTSTNPTNTTPGHSLTNGHSPSNTSNGNQTVQHGTNNGHSLPSAPLIPTSNQPHNPIPHNHVHQNATQSHPVQNGVPPKNQTTFGVEYMQRQFDDEKQAWLREKQSLISHTSNLDQQIKSLQSQLHSLQQHNGSLMAQNTQLTNRLATPAASSPASTELLNQFETLKSEHNDLIAEHEDLLVLLAETEDENRGYKEQLGIQEPAEEDHLL